MIKLIGKTSPENRLLVTLHAAIEYYVRHAEDGIHYKSDGLRIFTIETPAVIDQMYAHTMAYLLRTVDARYIAAVVKAIKIEYVRNCHELAERLHNVPGGFSPVFVDGLPYAEPESEYADGKMENHMKCTPVEIQFIHSDESIEDVEKLEHEENQIIFKEEGARIILSAMDDQYNSFFISDFDTDM